MGITVDAVVPAEERRAQPTSPPSRRAQLLVLADGLFAGLVAIGVTELRISQDEFEFRMSRAWRVWTAAGREDFPTFESGQHDFREVLSRLHNSKLPFGRYWPTLEPWPNGLDPEEYLLTRCRTASPEEWKELANAFMSSA